MKTNFSKSELAVIIGVVGAWAAIVNLLLPQLDPAIQGLLYMFMAIAMPVGFLIWTLLKKDDPFAVVFGLWSAIFNWTVFGNDGPTFWAAMKLLPVLAVISLIIITLLRWGKDNEEKAKTKAEEEAEKELDKMSNKEIASSIWSLIKTNRGVKNLSIAFVVLLLTLIAVIVIVFSATPL